jgi:hypothetical protein
MAVAVSVAYAWAISHAEDEVHVVKKDAAKMYVNHPAVVGHEDNLKLDPEKGTFRTCPLFEVNDVEYLREKNDKRLVVGNHMMTTCEGIEKWIKKELNARQ